MNEYIEKAQKFIDSNKYDYLLVNSTNEFLVEYNDLQRNSRFLLTDFSGSTGDALVSKDNIYLFVDGRYHVQADLQVNHDKISVVKLEISDNADSAIFEKIKHHSKVAICAKKNSLVRYEKFKELAKSKNIELSLINFDPILNTENNIRQDITDIPLKYTGLSKDEKIANLTKNLKDNEAIIISNLEDLSYLYNIRNFNKENSCSVEGKAIIAKFSDKLFTDDNLNDFENYIKKTTTIEKYYVDANSISVFDYFLIKNKAVIIEKPLIHKNIKTISEIQHYKDAFAKTDLALNATREFIKNSENISEFDIKTELENNFKKFGAKSQSFNSIVAINENSALAHYGNCSKDKILTEGSLVLIDCGAYYEGGLATDITRVFAKGAPNEEQKLVYTTVLKAFLRAYNTKDFTCGNDIDNIARNFLTQTAPNGFVFNHGLGHGIGVSVHEAPPRLSTKSNDSLTKMENNMCFTIEPGLYKQNKFGIRLENSCFINNGKITSFTNMCYEKDLINYSLLDEKEKLWLNSFEVK